MSDIQSTSTGHDEITVVQREKDPKRVESGKRLAAYNRAAKGRKCLESEDFSFDLSPLCFPLLVGAGVISGIAFLYFKRKPIEKELKVKPTEDSIKTNTLIVFDN